MIQKPIQAIELADLTALIGMSESKTLEFKREIAGNRDGDISLLAGVSALANEGGGDFIIGIEAGKDGMAKAVPGVELANLDGEKLRLEQLLKSCLEPRIPRIDIHTVLCSAGRHALIIRVARSWVGPHRVTKDNKFYGRNSSGKYPLDVGELRVAFGLRESAAERIRAFRADRLAKITGGETPIPMAGKAAVVLHMMPLASFADRALFDVVAAISSGFQFPLPLAGGSGANRSEINLDGILNYITHEKDGATSYAQLFRSGAIEGISLLNLDADGTPYIIEAPFSNMVVTAARQYLSVQRELETGFPVFAMLSLCNVSECRMKYEPSMGVGWHMSPAIKRDIVAFPEVSFNDSNDNVAAILRPVLNILSNGFGFAQSTMYNSSGDWNGAS